MDITRDVRAIQQSMLQPRIFGPPLSIHIQYAEFASLREAC
jgi:hypothetical protein